MSEYLKEISLSDDAFKIYLESLGRTPLSYNELYSLVPDLAPEEFTNIINELVNLRLLVQIVPQNPDTLLHYLALPPFSPILKFYSNIDLKISAIKNSIHEKLINSINQIKKNINIEIDTSTKQFQDVIKNISEECLVQKQKVEKKLEALDKLKEINQILPNLNELNPNLKKILHDLFIDIRGISQTQFGNLIKILSTIKDKMYIRVKNLNQKKVEDDVIKIIEDVFSKEFQQMLEEFISTISVLIELQFKNVEKPIAQLIEDSTIKKVGKPINEIVDKIFQSKNNLETVFFNSFNNFEIKKNEFQELLKNNIKNVESNLQNLENLVKENLSVIFQDSRNQILEEYKPIEKLIQQCIVEISSSDKTIIENIWLVKNEIKIIEEITNIFAKSKEVIILIIPEIDRYLKKEQFQELPETLKIKIASSDPSRSNLIKDLKNLKNVEFRTLKNNSIIALKSDNHIFIGIVQKDSIDPLNNIIGIGSNYKRLIDVLAPVIETSWSMAKTYIVEIVKEIEIKPQIPFNSDFVLKIQPKADDTTGMQINDVFNKLIQILGRTKITGEEFSKELQIVSDLILEKVGFCVTLHSISTWISIYKPKYALLDENDKEQILKAIASWKQKLF